MKTHFHVLHSYCFCYRICWNNYTYLPSTYYDIVNFETNCNWNMVQVKMLVWFTTGAEIDCEILNIKNIDHSFHFWFAYSPFLNYWHILYKILYILVITNGRHVVQWIQLTNRTVWRLWQWAYKTNFNNITVIIMRVVFY